MTTAHRVRRRRHLRSAAGVMALAAALTLVACDDDDDSRNPNVNAAPVFAGPFAVTSAENETATFTLDVSDPDGDAVTASLVDADDAALFTFDAGTLVATSAAPFDFETPQDQDGDNVYELTFSATDGALTTTQAYTVTIEDVVEPVVASLQLLGTYETGVFDEGAAEIVAFDPATDRLFVVNSDSATVDVLDIADPTTPSLVDTIETATPGFGGANSVAAANGLVAVAIEADPATDPGRLAYYSADTLEELASLEVGALPDMVTFSPDGLTVLVANEGEPNDDYTIDPAGSVSIGFVSGIIDGTSQPTAILDEVGFTDFDGQEDDLRAQGVRIFGPGASASQDFEPEFITVSADGATAWAILQENNALVEIDVAARAVSGVIPLGRKDFSAEGHEIDASDDDGVINIQNWPAFGLYQPDAIATYAVDGETFIVTANEGDARDYDGFSEEARVSDLALDPTAFPDAATLQLDENLGRLEVTTVDSGETDVTEIVSFGGRSFSIWATDGTLVYDSGSDFERITSERLPDDFNSTNDENDSFDSRSDAKGPEPEGVALGAIGVQTFAFIGLERIGGIMIYDITDPTAPIFNDYVNNRDFSVDVLSPDDSLNPAAGDLGPEGLLFIAAEDSPIDEPLLVVGNEVSGTTSIFRVTTAEVVIQD